MEKDYLSLIKFALNKELSMSVLSEQGDELLKCSDFSEIKSHVESKEECVLAFWNNSKVIGYASVMTSHEFHDTVFHLTDCEFLNKWHESQ